MFQARANNGAGQGSGAAGKIVSQLARANNGAGQGSGAAGKIVSQLAQVNSGAGQGRGSVVKNGSGSGSMVVVDKTRKQG